MGDKGEILVGISGYFCGGILTFKSLLGKYGYIYGYIKGTRNVRSFCKDNQKDVEPDRGDR